MRFRLAIVTTTLACLTAGSAAAQEVDARAALEAAAEAMGLDRISSVEYSGHGFSSRIGQQYSVNGGWPTYQVVDYTRQIDYESGWSREDYVRQQGDYERFGRPPLGPEPVTAIVSGEYAWDIRDGEPAALTRPYLDGAPWGELRQLEIAITPHGFLKAALAAGDATAISLPIVGASDFGVSQFGKQVTIVSFTYLDKYKINGTITEENLVELVGTWIPNPVYGDMDYEMRYTRYADVEGVMFPMLFHTHQADPRLNPAHNYYEYQITDVVINPDVETLPVPATIRAAVTPDPVVESEALAEGIWRLAGGSHHSILVEFRDFLAVVEAPQNEARSLAVLEAAKRLVPGKHVQYVVNTHHHFDHAGGLRTYLSQGTTIVTHESNKDYYLDILFHPAPRTLQPDRMSHYNPMYWISRRPAPIETVSGEARGTGRYAITDGEQILEVFHVQDMYYELGDRSMRYGHHSEDMLMVWLPRAGILVNADLFSPRGGVPSEASLGMVTLNENIKKLRLDVERHVPIHGEIIPHEDFLAVVGRGL